MHRNKRNRNSINQRGFTRLAMKDDCDFIRKLSGEVFSVFGDYSRIIPQWFVNQDVIAIIYVSNGGPLGFAMLSVPTGEILALAVIPKYRRSGIGTALLKGIEYLAGEFGIRRLSLHTAKENETAQLFFQKAGFKVIGTQKKYYPEGQPALTMVKYI